jgi:hypothetical protein
MDEEKQEFVVKDRRRFTSEGSAREGEEVKKEEKVQEPKAAENQAGPKPEAGEAGAQSAAQFPEVTFSTFLLSLMSSSLVHLGEVPDPASGNTEKNLPLAKQTIDIIAMLKNKTKGNLSEDEQGMVDHVLYDLRMRFVKSKE